MSLLEHLERFHVGLDERVVEKRKERLDVELSRRIIEKTKTTRLHYTKRTPAHGDVVYYTKSISPAGLI